MTIDELIAAAAKCGPWEVREYGGIRTVQGWRCPIEAVALSTRTYVEGLDVDAVMDAADGAPEHDPALRARLLRELVGEGA